MKNAKILIAIASILVVGGAIAFGLCKGRCCCKEECCENDASDNIAGKEETFV